MLTIAILVCEIEVLVADLYASLLSEPGRRRIPLRPLGAVRPVRQQRLGMHDAVAIRKLVDESQHKVNQP